VLPEVKPTLDISMSEAIQRLTGFEIQRIKKQLKRPNIHEGDPIETMYAVVWAYENRTAPTTWETVMALEMHEVQGYFQPESVEPDDAMGE